MTRYILFLLTALIVISCDSNPYSITMQDGVTIQYVSTPKYYSTEDDFVHNVAFDFPHPYDYAMPQHIDYVSWTVSTPSMAIIKPLSGIGKEPNLEIG